MINESMTEIITDNKEMKEECPNETKFEDIFAINEPKQRKRKTTKKAPLPSRPFSFFPNENEKMMKKKQREEKKLAKPFEMNLQTNSNEMKHSENLNSTPMSTSLPSHTNVSFFNVNEMNPLNSLNLKPLQLRQQIELQPLKEKNSQNRFNDDSDDSMTIDYDETTVSYEYEEEIVSKPLNSIPSINSIEMNLFNPSPKNYDSIPSFKTISSPDSVGLNPFKSSTSSNNSTVPIQLTNSIGMNQNILSSLNKSFEIPMNQSLNNSFDKLSEEKNELKLTSLTDLLLNNSSSQVNQKENEMKEENIFSSPNMKDIGKTQLNGLKDLNPFSFLKTLDDCKTSMVINSSNQKENDLKKEDEEDEIKMIEEIDEFNHDENSDTIENSGLQFMEEYV